MKKALAFVLGGGGSRGALQVGSLYALLEHGLQPDLLVGTSIGAVNATFLALNGFSRESLDRLSATWHRAAEMDLLPSNYIQTTLRAMLGRSSTNPAHRIQDFFIQNGLTPDLCFSDIQHLHLVIVTADLNSGKPVLYGEEPEAKVLDALLMSTALPPWNMPVKKQSQFLMDGGVLSNLPIQPALRIGATHIVALDLLDARELFGVGNKFGYFLDRLTFSVQQRQVDLELELAKAQGVPVFHLGLIGNETVALWDFHHTQELIAQGYEMTQRAITASPDLFSSFPAAS
jgi:NTE family protein